MPSVTRERNGAGFWTTRVNGPGCDAVQDHFRRVAKLRNNVGRPVDFAISGPRPGQMRRPPRSVGYLPRNCQIGVRVDELVKANFDAEAKRRGLTAHALAAMLLEIIVDDSLFVAILGLPK